MFRPRPRGACRRALGWPVQGRVIGFIGRFVAEKGLPTLISAVARLEQNTRLVLAGSGPMEEELRQITGKVLPGRTRFQRPLPRKQMPVLLGAFDALVLPSRTTAEWKEQFGRVLAEAMACGRLALGSNSGEIPAVLGDARLIFREGDSAGLARMLDALVVRGGGKQLAAGLRKRAHSQFSEKYISSRTGDFFLRLIDRRVSPL